MNQTHIEAFSKLGQDMALRVSKLLDAQAREYEAKMDAQNREHQAALQRLRGDHEVTMQKSVKAMTAGFDDFHPTKGRKVAAAPLPTKGRKVAGRPTTTTTAKPAAKAAKRAVSERSADRLVDRLVSVMKDKTMDAGEVVAALEKVGKAPNSANVQNYISFTLSQNDDTFERVARGKYRVISGKADRVVSVETSTAESDDPSTDTDEELNELGINTKGIASNPFPAP